MRKNLALLIILIFYGVSYAQETLRGSVTAIAAMGDSTIVQLSSHRVYIAERTPSNVRDILLSPELVGKQITIISEDVTDEVSGVTRKVAVGTVIQATKKEENKDLHES
jgi:hypothetical protein